MKQRIKEYYKKQTVLIAEDHQKTRELMQFILNDYFSEVLVSVDGQECMDKVEIYNPDMMITDIQMPKFNGLESIERIRNKNSKLPIIVISAFKDEEFLFKAANLDIQGYLLKPFDTDILESTLEKIYTQTVQVEEYPIKGMLYSPQNSSIKFDGQTITLTFKENALLRILVDKEGSVVPYELLEYELWDKFDEMMSYNSLRSLVKKLRNKIPVSDVIKNVSKQGYCLES